MSAPAKRVLVVEDELSIREIEERMLRAAGFEVAGADDGFQALQALETQTFDLFVLDVMMAGMTGFELARALRERCDTARTPILFVTARDDQASVAEGFNAGASLYLMKPFTSATLLTMVRGALATAEGPA